MFRKISLTKPAITSLNVSYNIIKLLRQSIPKGNNYTLTITLNNKIASYLQLEFVFACVTGESKNTKILMKYIYTILFLVLAAADCYAFNDTTVVIVPLQRRYFHDKISNEQKLCDKADGKIDSFIQAGKNESVNQHITDAMFRKVKELQNWIELNDAIKNNNDKIRYLAYIESMLKSFRIYWKKREVNAVIFPSLMENFEQILKAQVEGKSMAPLLESVSYDVARINTEIFPDNTGYKDAKDIVYLKFCKQNPERILQTIKLYVNRPFADSLIIIAARENPVQLYSYAQSTSSAEGRLIHNSSDSLVKTVAKLSQTPNALFYFPFLDDILKGKKTIDSISRYIGKNDNDYDSVGYYKLLVKTSVEYYKRMASPLRDTPIAMFGANGLREVLKVKALQHFVTPINVLHDQSNLAVRMKAIEPLTARELYYMMVMGENDIYTSSYKHSFNRMLQQMGAKPSGDSLLLSVHFDYFRKFIKMAANYNKLDTFLKTMPAEKSELVMKAFVSRLDKTGNLEDAVDVADAYSSISDIQLQKTILNYVIENEQSSINEDNERGKVIYGLLKSIFLSADSTNKIDLTSVLGIPSIYEIDNKSLRDTSGKIVQQVYWYGDEDGKIYFPAFINSFSPKEWKITPKKEWYEINSLKGNVWIYANRPLDNDANLDDSAQIHLNKYLEDNDLHPSVIVHRGHSYWLPRTIRRMPGEAKIVVLGSCGGYKNLNDIIDSNPDAHIISTKEIGAGEINRPISNYLNQAFESGAAISWKSMWASLTKLFTADQNKTLLESWEDYIPPYKNLGAIFIKAYNKKMESE